jgi:hypothetical protein
MGVEWGMAMLIGVAVAKAKAELNNIYVHMEELCAPLHIAHKQYIV